MRHPLQPSRILHPFGEKLCRCYLPEESILVRHPSAFRFLPAASGEFLPVIIGLAHRRSRFKWAWLLARSPAEFPRTRRARGFSGRGPRESIDRVWKNRERGEFEEIRHGYA